MNLMFNANEHVYFIGIGGAGVSAIARYAARHASHVLGSDLASSTITEGLVREGIDVQIGETLLPDDTMMVVYSPAVPENAPQRQQARQRGIPEYSYPEILGKIMQQYPIRIAVSGTNGKSTTTSMLGSILERAGMDPTVILGSLAPQWGTTNLRLGRGKVIVVEACEYREHFHELSPTHVVITNIEEEHLDYFRDLDHLYESFSTFIRPAQCVVLNERVDPKKLFGLESKRHVVVGSSSKQDLYASDVQTDDASQVFQIAGKGVKSFDVRLHAPGQYNIENALAAVAIGLECSAPVAAIQDALSSFRGLWRRFELRGSFQDAAVISDYAHHPTAVRFVIAAARQFYPNHRIIVVFQPHHRSRTQELYADFAAALETADQVLLLPIYDVAGRETDNLAVDSSIISQAMTTPNVKLVESTDQARSILQSTISSNDVILILGAGDIDAFATQLTQ